MDRPPPYFPQSKLSPSSENRYRNFKLTVGIAIFALSLILIGAGVGIFYFNSLDDRLDEPTNLFDLSR